MNIGAYYDLMSLVASLYDYKFCFLKISLAGVSVLTQNLIFTSVVSFFKAF